MQDLVLVGLVEAMGFTVEDRLGGYTNLEVNLEGCEWWHFLTSYTL